MITAPHSPLLMAYPGARFLEVTKYGPKPVTLRQTGHSRMLRELLADPAAFLEVMPLD